MAGASDALYRTGDGGLTWESAGAIPAPVADLAISPRLADTLFAATTGGLFITEDGGRTWRAALAEGKPVSLVEALADGRVFAFVIGEGLFVGGAGGSLRAGVTVNPVRLTRSVRSRLTRVTCGGAPVYVWPGGGITLMVDVGEMPENSFGYVPTPALVAPIEFTLPLDDYVALGGYGDRVRPLADVLKENDVRSVPWRDDHDWPYLPQRSGDP